MLPDAPIYIAADVHWSPGGATGTFGHFLGALAQRARGDTPVQLYILGDLFDLWLEGAGQILGGYQNHLGTLRGAAEDGVEIRVLWGNRDFMAGRELEERTGIRVLGDRAVLPGGLLLEHGDLLCTQDWRYQLYRRVIRSDGLRLALGELEPDHLRTIAGWMRRASVAEIKRKAPTALRVASEAVEERLSEGFAGVVCGHVHRPEQRPVRGGTLWVLGDWSAERGSYATVGDNGVRLKSFPG